MKGFAESMNCGCVQVQEESRCFVAEVMGDDKLQREGGDALWNSVRHALKPGFIRYVSLCRQLLCHDLNLYR